MIREQFEQQVREHLHRRPFQPFIVERREGEPILIDDPNAMAFNGGAAGFISPDAIHMFRCEEVTAIRLPQETAS